MALVALLTNFDTRNHEFAVHVARIERSEMRERPLPDFAALNPGYSAYADTLDYVGTERSNSNGTMGRSLELRRVSEVLTLRTCGAAVRSVTKA